MNRKLLIIAIIAFVNALGYGIIIPILYSYSIRFGLTDFQNGMLFSVFSICQFISTPFIGRLSDKFGRRPLLITSIAGTAVSFFMAAFAPNAIFLFLARALDGLTAGNIPVAAAVISDSTNTRDRAKGFGIIGASFGFGFVFGPAISAFTVSYSPSLPFIIAGIVSLVAVVLTMLFLPETNKHIGEVKKGKIFDLKKLFHAITDESVGLTLLITLIYNVAFGILIFAFQPFSIKVMNLSANQIATIFTVFGVVGLATQILILPRITRIFSDKKVLRYCLLLMAVAFFAIILSRSLTYFVIVSILIGFSNSFVGPLIQTILSKETDDKSQGSIQGINASYISIGTIFGPLLGGLLATMSLKFPFIAAGIISFACFLLSFNVLKRGIKKESAF